MKKGFTLVELLAVIAILAILVIIALPNVMGMFNTAKENSFNTEIKEIYKTAQQTWINDSMFQSGEKVYSRCKSGCTNSLDLTGRSELEYYIRINQSGEVVEFYATDGTYQYQSDKVGLKIEDINGVQKVADTSDKVVIDSSLTAYLNDKFCVDSTLIPKRKNMTWKSFIDYVTNNIETLDDFSYGDRKTCAGDGCYYDILSYKGIRIATFTVNSQYESNNGWKIRLNSFGKDGVVNYNFIHELDLEVIKDSTEGCYSLRAE